MLLLVEVKGRDVLAVLAARKAEHDLAAEPSRPGQRFVEDRRPVRGADEQDVVVRRLERRDPKVEPGAVECYEARNIQSVECEVHQPAQLADDHARVVDAVHQDEQHVQPELPAAEHPAHAAHHSAASASAHARSPLAERVDLVDEDDASAPGLGLLARGADHEEHAERIDAEEHAGEGAARGDVDGDMKR